MKRDSEPRGERRKFGRYELLFELAKGGMARVFVARQVGDAGFERLVAVKRVHPHLAAEPDVFAMASDEARLTALLHHPHVVSVIDVLDAEGELLLVQEYIEGLSLSALLRRLAGPLPPPIASRIAVDALKGLAAAHDARDLLGQPLGIVHRDMSPQNVIVGADGMTRVVDFGIARAEGRMTATKTGVVKGKVVYMAPEQLEGKPVDRRADLFAVGAILFELVAGRRLFDVEDEAAQMARVLLADVDLAPAMSAAPALVPALARALARRPADRFATASDFARALVEAAPLAGDDDVRALVLSCGADELALRRARIRERIGDLSGDVEPGPLTQAVGAAGAEGGGEAARPGPSSAEAPTEAAPPPAPAPRRRAWPGVVAAMVSVLGMTAWVASRRAPPPPVLSRGVAAALQGPLRARESPAVLPAPAAARAPASPTRADDDPGSAAPTSDTPPPVTSRARAPDLLRNPYARRPAAAP